MGGKGEEGGEDGDLDDPPADAQQAGNESDPEAGRQRQPEVEPVAVAIAVRVGEGPRDGKSTAEANRNVSTGLEQQESCDEHERTAHDNVERSPRDGADDERPNDRPGDSCRGQDQSGGIVDAPQPEITDRARGHVGEDHGQRYRGQLGRRLLRINQQKDWDQGEAASSADQGAISTDAHAYQRPDEKKQRTQERRPT